MSNRRILTAILFVLLIAVIAGLVALAVTNARLNSIEDATKAEMDLLWQTNTASWGTHYALMTPTKDG